MRVSSSVVLVVDDDPNIGELVATILEPDGFTVVTARSGEEALERFGEHVIDVVFTDIQMKGMSGFELLSRILRIDRTVKVIVMTSYGSFEAVLNSLQTGAYDYIEKPLQDHSRVLNTVHKAYEHVMLARDNEMLLAKLKASHLKLAGANARLVSLNKQLKKMAVTDGLTGLYNRRYFDRVLKREFGRHQRYGDTFSVLMMDIDYFKAFNDQHGHDGGDQALKQVAGIIKKSGRTTDIAGRYGGEEFYLLLTNTTPEAAMIVAERVRSAIEESPLEIGSRRFGVTVSVGVAGVSKEHTFDSIRDLLVSTDAALYDAKRLGRNRVCLCLSPSDDQPIQQVATG